MALLPGSSQRYKQFKCERVKYIIPGSSHTCRNEKNPLISCRDIFYPLHTWFANPFKLPKGHMKRTKKVCRWWLSWTKDPQLFFHAHPIVQQLCQQSLANFASFYPILKSLSLYYTSWNNILTTVYDNRIIDVDWGLSSSVSPTRCDFWCFTPSTSFSTLLCCAVWGVPVYSAK